MGDEDGVRSRTGTPNPRRTSLKVGEGEQPAIDREAEAGDPEAEKAQRSLAEGMEGPTSDDPGPGDILALSALGEEKVGGRR